MEEKKVLLREENGIAWITLNSPRDLNSFDRELAVGLQSALEQCEITDQIRVVVLQGEGRAFSGGGNIAFMKEMSDKHRISELAYGTRRLSNCIRAVRRIKKPVIAAVHGAAAGGACSLALACDFRILAEDAKLLEPYLGIALVPDMGGAYILSRYLGFGRLGDYIYLGQPISAAKAVELGLANQAVPAGELQSRVKAYAERLCALPKDAFSRTKLMVNMTCFPNLDAVLEQEEDFQWDMLGGEDFREGIAAFLEKRSPGFRR